MAGFFIVGEKDTIRVPKLAALIARLEVLEAGGGGGGGGVTSFNTRTGAVTLTTADIVAAGALLAVNNLSDVTSAATSRANLGLGTAATHAATDFASSGAVTASGLTMATARILGRTTAGTGAIEELTASAAKTFLAITAGDVSGLAAIATSGSASDLVAGTVPAARLGAFTGDVTTPGGSYVTTITAAAKTAIRRINVSTSAGTTYTLSSADIYGHVRFTNAGAITLTVDTTHGFSAGDRCRFTSAGAGQVTIVASGTTINSRGGALKSTAQYAVFELECVGANAFDLLGDVTT